MDRWDSYNVIAVSFEEDRNAYSALTLLGELAAQSRVGVQEAAVVVRGEDGQVVEKDRIEPTAMPATLGGGLIGLLVGIIGGPFGVLIGGASGLFVGSLFDIHDIDETESALGGISSSVTVGRAALLAVVAEQTPEVVDTAMSGLGGTVLRRSVADLEAEIAAAERAQHKAESEARRELLRAHREHDRAAVGAKIEALKGRLHREPRAADADDAAAPAANAR